MKYQTEVKVLGMKSSKGKMDNGVEFDSTKVFIETPLDDSRGNAKGFSVAEYSLGTADEFNKYKHLPFPFMGQAQIEIVVSGKNQKMVMTELRPLEIAKPSKAG